MFHEYPKFLCQGGDPEGAFAIVKDAAEEAARRSEGFRVAWEPEEKAQEPVSEPIKRKPGRPRKVQQ